MNDKTLALLVFEAVVFFGTIFVGIRAAKMLEKGKPRDAVWSVLSTVFGVAAGILGFLATRITRERNKPFQLTDETRETFPH